MALAEYDIIHYALIEKRNVLAKLKLKGAEDWHIDAKFEKRDNLNELAFYVINGAWHGILNRNMTIMVEGAEKKLYEVEIEEIQITTPENSKPEIPF
jgi:hypothetical protein